LQGSFCPGPRFGKPPESLIQSGFPKHEPEQKFPDRLSGPENKPLSTTGNVLVCTDCRNAIVFREEINWKEGSKKPGGNLPPGKNNISGLGTPSEPALHQIEQPRP